MRGEPGKIIRVFPLQYIASASSSADIDLHDFSISTGSLGRRVYISAQQNTLDGFGSMAQETHPDAKMGQSSSLLPSQGMQILEGQHISFTASGSLTWWKFVYRIEKEDVQYA